MEPTIRQECRGYIGYIGTLQRLATARSSMAARIMFIRWKRIVRGILVRRWASYCRQNTRSIGQIIRALNLIREVYEPGEMNNRIEFI